jgi:putative MATE family efflux protein
VSTALPRGVTGPLGRELMRLAVPVFFSFLLRIAYQWVDALWVKGLGVEATAAVTTSVFVMWSVYSINDIVGIGAAAYVSQLLGAGERARAGVAAFHGLRASALLGLFGTLAGFFAVRHIYQLMSTDAGVVTHGVSYLSVLLVFAPIPMMALTAETVMRAAGDTRTPLIVDLFAIGLNAVLDPLLIYGWGPFPRMGVAGAAWATVIAQTVMVACYVTLAARGHRAFPFARTAPGPPIRTAGMARVGAPGAIIGLLFSAVYIAFARAAGAFGPAALAVVGVANRVEALHFVGSVSFGSAAATLVGQNLGAKRPDRAVAAILTANRWNLWGSGILTVAFFAVPGVFLNFFSRDPEVHRIGAEYLRVLSLCLPFVGIEIVTAEGIIGSGHTRAISAIFTTFSLLRIPLAFIVPAWNGLGVIGIAWLITVTAVLRSMIIVAWAMRRTWLSGLAKELERTA